MTRPPRYLPILKGKRGEFDALAELADATRGNVYPLVEVLPGSEEQDVEQAVEKAVRALSTSWFKEPVMLDVSALDPAWREQGQTVLGFAMDMAKIHLNPVAVVRLFDSDEMYRDAANASGDGVGAAVRLVSEDLDLEPDELNEVLARVLAALTLDADETDLIIDVGAIGGDFAVSGGSRLIKSLLRDLEHFDEYRSVTVAAGAFPPNMSDVAAWTVGEHPRDDAALYNRIRSRPLSRMVDFGDYGIAHPQLTTAAPFAPAPQLRYTVADRWLTLRGRLNDPRGNSQFFDICAVIASRPEFVGAALGEADRRIAEGRLGGHRPGNATTWRTIGTQHHIDLVVSRLTNLGEP